MDPAVTPAATTTTTKPSFFLIVMNSMADFSSPLFPLTSHPFSYSFNITHFWCVPCLFRIKILLLFLLYHSSPSYLHHPLQSISDLRKPSSEPPSALSFFSSRFSFRHPSLNEHSSYGSSFASVQPISLCLCFNCIYSHSGLVGGG